MVCSMTAFAKKEVKCIWGSVSWEIRSLNHRYLDISVDVPKYLRELAWEIRKKVKGYLCRGKIDCYLNLEINDNIFRDFVVDKELVHFLISSAQWIKNQVHEGCIDPFSVLSWPGVVKCKQDCFNAIGSVLLQSFEETLFILKQDREREGLFLKGCILEKLHSMDKELDGISKNIPVVLELKRDRFLEQINNLGISVDSVCLEQELLVVMQKIDISEEMDRLVSHIQEMYKVLSLGGVLGRRLDFLVQEIYREVNTVASKSVSTDVTRAVISLKIFAEQIREQVQNIE